MNIKILFRWLLLSSCALALACDSSSSTAVEEAVGDIPVAPRALYVLTNEAGTNAVRSYTRDSSGGLSFFQETPTGGSGTGMELESSGNAIVFDPLTELLFAVNPGSNSLTVFLVETDGSLRQLDTANSGGVKPISLAVNYDTVYALNAGDLANPANIVGFRVIAGQLVQIDSSTRPLSTANPNPAQIEFATSGTILTVTERASNRISHYTLDGNRAASAPISLNSGGMTPDGFDYTAGGTLISAESATGAAGAGSVSSYFVAVGAATTLVSNALPTGQTSTSAVKALHGAPFVYLANSGSDSISTLTTASNDGNVVVTGVPVPTEAGPVELASSEDERYLYVLNRGSDSISVFNIDQSTGALTPNSTLTGLPPNSGGLTGR